MPGKLANPTGLTITPLTGTNVRQVQLSWNPVPNAENYELEGRRLSFISVASGSHDITVTKACCTRTAQSRQTPIPTTPSVQITGLPTTLDLGAQGNRPLRFTVSAAGLSADKLYRITINTTSDSLGFNDSCTDRVEERLYSGGVSESLVGSLYACGATTGAVSVEVGEGIRWEPGTSLPNLGATTVVLSLENATGGGFAGRFRVRANHNDENMNSDFSDPIIVIDTPITRASGDSPNTGGQAALEWIPVESILGPAYSGGTYSFWYRRFLDYEAPHFLTGVHEPHTHVQIGWQPEEYGTIGTSPSDGDAPIRGARHTITGLGTEKIYAIQLVYEVTIQGVPNRVFAARDVYVWPSARAAKDGERVATFPLDDTLDINSRIYEYRICLDTFPADKRSAWKNIIVHAFGQWEIATDGLVRMIHLGSDCADFANARSEAYGMIQNRIGRPLTAEEDEGLKKFVKTTRDWLSMYKEDRTKNEVIMLDHSTIPLSAFQSVKVSAELASLLGFTACFFDEPISGCAVSSRESGRSDPEDYRTARVVSTDIYLPHTLGLDDAGMYKPTALEIPSDNSWNPARDDVPLNSCISISYTREPDPPVYDTLVHEAGHALGIGDGRTTGYTQHHPSIPRSVANYNQTIRYTVHHLDSSYSENDCSPHPFDIMAIFALYQTAQ